MSVIYLNQGSMIDGHTLQSPLSVLILEKQEFVVKTKGGTCFSLYKSADKNVVLSKTIKEHYS